MYWVLPKRMHGWAAKTTASCRSWCTLLSEKLERMHSCFPSPLEHLVAISFLSTAWGRQAGKAQVGSQELVHRQRNFRELSWSLGQQPNIMGTSSGSGLCFLEFCLGHLCTPSSQSCLATLVLWAALLHDSCSASRKRRKGVWGKKRGMMTA